MRQDPNAPQAPKLPNLDQMMGEAENTLQQGLQTLTEWGDQARKILKDRPGAVIASVSIAGFMTGLLLRQRKLLTQSNNKPAADPMVMFVAGAVAGFAMGPRVMQELNSQEPAGQNPEQSAPPARTPLP
jgi:hypothetical protein